MVRTIRSIESMQKDRKGQMIMINMLFFLMAIAVLVAMIPAMKELLNIAQQSDGLNCVGYVKDGDVNHPYSYNSSLQTSTLACISIKLYLPYVVIVVLVGGVTKLLYSRTEPTVV